MGIFSALWRYNGTVVVMYVFAQNTKTSVLLHLSLW